VINSKRTLTPGTPEYGKELGNIFFKMQTPLNNEREIELSLKDKNYKDIKVESRFKGNSDRGQEAFNRIAENHDYQDFHFFPQTISSEDDIKNNPQN
jgi:hypothetical protein